MRKYEHESVWHINTPIRHSLALQIKLHKSFFIKDVSFYFGAVTIVFCCLLAGKVCVCVQSCARARVCVCVCVIACVCVCARTRARACVRVLMFGSCGSVCCCGIAHTPCLRGAAPVQYTPCIQ